VRARTVANRLGAHTREVAKRRAVRTPVAAKRRAACTRVAAKRRAAHTQAVARRRRVVHTPAAALAPTFERVVGPVAGRRLDARRAAAPRPEDRRLAAAVHRPAGEQRLLAATPRTVPPQGQGARQSL